jgi:3alpha(or 20beta)-hydroxysteroid dehydrogenase
VGRLDGKTAIITGAARGTGEAAARLFAQEGARVLVADVLEERGRAVAESLGSVAAFERLDVTSEADWQHTVERCVERFGSVNVLVNNAGVLLIKSIAATEAAEFQRVVAVNQLGTFLGIKAVIDAMKAAGGGAIVNVASIDGLRGRNGLVAYAASKWAVRGITRVAALELGRFGIRVNVVCPEAGSPEMIAPYIPPGVDMEQVLGTQQPFLITQQQRTIAERVGDIAKLVLFLASDDSASCTGADFSIDGGNSAGKLIRGLPGA